MSYDKETTLEPEALMGTLLEPSPEFNAWVKTLPAKSWAKHDLSAVRLGWEAARRTPSPGSEGAGDDAARRIANWLGYDWDGLPERRITDKGLPVWTSNGRFQGGKQDLRDLASELSALTAAPQPPVPAVPNVPSGLYGEHTPVTVGTSTAAVRDGVVGAREAAIEECAKLIEDRNRNNVGMVHPISIKDAAALRALSNTKEVGE